MWLVKLRLYGLGSLHNNSRARELHPHSSHCYSLCKLNFNFRAEKSEALTEDVQYAEKHIDQLKLSCSTTAKKIYGLMSGILGVLYFSFIFRKSFCFDRK